MDRLTSRASLAILGLVSGSVVAVEVLMTRLLSLSTWYGLAFVVLSLAMLGLTAGSLSADAARRAKTPLQPWLASRLLRLSASLLGAVFVVTAVPLKLELRP